VVRGRKVIGKYCKPRERQENAVTIWRKPRRKNGYDCKSPLPLPPTLFHLVLVRVDRCLSREEMRREMARGVTSSGELFKGPGLVDTYLYILRVCTCTDCSPRWPGLSCSLQFVQSAPFPKSEYQWLCRYHTFHLQCPGGDDRSFGWVGRYICRAVDSIDTTVL
jgi:hypothetical protein